MRVEWGEKRKSQTTLQPPTFFPLLFLSLGQSPAFSSGRPACSTFFFLRSHRLREGKAFYFSPSPLSVPPIIPPPPSRGTLLSLAAIRLVCVSFLSSLFFFHAPPPPPLWGPLAALNLHYAGFEAAAGDHSSAKGCVYARASRTHTHTHRFLSIPPLCSVRWRATD